jgi:hypothetical protein
MDQEFLPVLKTLKANKNFMSVVLMKFYATIACYLKSLSSLKFRVTEIDESAANT